MKGILQWMLRVLAAFAEPGGCEHPGCGKPARAFRYPYAADVHFNWCREHVGTAGFCWICGGFFLGIDEDIEEIGVCMECRNREAAKPVDSEGPPWEES